MEGLVICSLWNGDFGRLGEYGAMVEEDRVKGLDSDASEGSVIEEGMVDGGGATVGREEGGMHVYAAVEGVIEDAGGDAAAKGDSYNEVQGPCGGNWGLWESQY